MSEQASNWRVVVCTLESEPVGWRLPSAELHEQTEISGGIRTLHELAVAAAVSGRTVELRGPVSRPVLDALAGAAGSRPRLPTDERRPDAREIVVLPNGGYDLARFARCVLSPARHVLALLAPTGQFGWPFISPWHPQPHLTVPLETLCRPEHFRAMTALGIDLWTHMVPAYELARAAGARCTFIGNGEPTPPPPARSVKNISVVYLQANRWWPLAEEVAGRMSTPVRAIPPGDHETVMDALASAQVLLWPARVEGDGRLLREARACGTVVVGLSSNAYATGLNEASGAIAVDQLERMPGVVEELLADPERLKVMAEAGRRTAREQVDWARYVERVDTAIRASETRPEEPPDSALAAFGKRIEMLVGEGSDALSRVRELDAQLAGVNSRLTAVDREFEEARARIAQLELELSDAGERVMAASSALAIARAEPARHIRTTVMLADLARRAERRLGWSRRRALTQSADDSTSGSRSVER
jgi:Glycosyl transferases group 1